MRWIFLLLSFACGVEALADEAGVTAGVDASANLLSMGLTVAVGQNKSSDADLFSGNTLSVSRSETTAWVSDLFPMASLRWNKGLHNYLAYSTFNIPLGTSDSNSLSNISPDHSSWELGGGYTYSDSRAGNEFSANLGFTFDLENFDTNYQNGINSHLDLATAHFFTDKFLVGLVGYYYFQLTDDSESGVGLGGFRSQVAGVGPQFGSFFAVDGKQWYVNLKGFYNFDAENRPTGWNLLLALAIPL